jgi:hypothetical protein
MPTLTETTFDVAAATSSENPGCSGGGSLEIAPGELAAERARAS